MTGNTIGDRLLVKPDVGNRPRTSARILVPINAKALVGACSLIDLEVRGGLRAVPKSSSVEEVFQRFTERVVMEDGPSLENGLAGSQQLRRVLVIREGQRRCDGRWG